MHTTGQTERVLESRLNVAQLALAGRSNERERPALVAFLQRAFSRRRRAQKLANRQDEINKQRRPFRPSELSPPVRREGGESGDDEEGPGRERDGRES